MKDSHIQWTTNTFNPWIGCTKVSPGCLHCYAESLNKRWKNGANWGKGAPRTRTSESNWRQPITWNKAAAASGERPRVFCASLADWLDDEVPIAWLADLLSLIHATPNLDWLLLTKRPENWKPRIEAAEQFMIERTPRDGLDAWLTVTGWMTGEPLQNVWIGTTVEDQARANERIPALHLIPARVRFLSCEPLLGPVSFGIRKHNGWDMYRLPDGTETQWGIDWIICGGESGAGAREMHADWARELRHECEDSGVAFFMKQMGGARDKRGELGQIPEDLRVRQFPARQ